MRKVLIVSVHPDDETLGCGGTILKHSQEGYVINWLIITNVSTEEGYSPKRVNERQEEIEQVSRNYGFDQTIKLDYPTKQLDMIERDRLINSISSAIDRIKPQVIYLANKSDVHSDHKIAFDAVYSCTKNFRKPFIGKIMMYETLSESEFAPPLPGKLFIPNVFVDISEYMNKKLEIMKLYKSELMSDNLPRSISAMKAQAGYRGSRIGVEYAEAFMLLFEKC